jgi:hypothetical protein
VVCDVTVQLVEDGPAGDRSMKFASSRIRFLTHRSNAMLRRRRSFQPAMPIDSPVPFEPAEHHERPEVALCAMLYRLSRFTFGGGCTRIRAYHRAALPSAVREPSRGPLLRRTCAQSLDGGRNSWQEQSREAAAAALMQEVLSKAMQNC